MTTVSEIADVLRDLERLSHGDPEAVAQREQILATKRALVARLAETDDEPPPEHKPSAVVCARPGCTEPVASRQHSYGRPPIYFSPECRPSYKRDPRTVTVELDHDDDDGRYWTVRLRRGHRTVLVGQHLGRFSATLLYRDLDQLLHPRSAPKGGAID